MNEEMIRKYADLMGELDLTAIEVSEEGKTLRLERSAAKAVVSDAPVAAAPKAEAKAEPGVFEITSPMVGIVYAAAAENEEPFVVPGSRVKKGDTLCIIEAMKLMNEVVAERDGVITEVCVTNGQVVDFGTVLFKMGE